MLKCNVDEQPSIYSFILDHGAHEDIESLMLPKPDKLTNNYLHE